MHCSVDNRLKARHGQACATVLTEQQAREILTRRRHAQRLAEQAKQFSNHALAAHYGINHKSVGRIINGHRWKTGSGKSRYRNVDSDAVAVMRKAGRERDRLKTLASEHSIKRLADEYGVSESLVDQIGTGCRWVYLFSEDL